MPTDRASWIAAIRAAPDDDDLRLICADWFEEQGGEANVARAEFIRTQIERARLAPEDLRQSELQAREIRLVKRFAAAWCGSHFVFKKVRFRRGFIEYVHLHLQHFLHHRRQMFALEPVRDVRLTGWFRAPTDLIRRVAECEEWRSIETLRIHRQGPHKDPRGNLIVLLESPHLTGLRALHCPTVAFDSDARRRFERLSVLRRLTELRFPYLDFVQRPGDWFSDGGATSASEWGELKSLRLPPFLPVELLQRLSELPFWNRLTALDLQVPGHTSTHRAFAILRDRMPPSLRELRLRASSTPLNPAGVDSFFHGLAEVPLRVMHLDSIPISPEMLGHLLDGTNRWDLRELSLRGGGEMTAAHAQALARAPGATNLRSLNLSGNWNFNAAAAQALFASGHFPSLAHLNLNYTRIGTEWAAAFAAAEGWDGLRSLDLSHSGLDRKGLLSLLASSKLRHLNWFSVGGSGYDDEPPLGMSPDLASALTDTQQMPHLVSLQVAVPRCDARSRQLLTRSEDLLTVSIECEDEPDDETYRGDRPPNPLPLDATMEEPFAGTGRV
jgi:uncharacterized protein (TIGR02996 family)